MTKQLIIKCNWTRVVGLTSLITLVLLGLMLVSPILPVASYADADPGNPPELQAELTTVTSAYLYSMIAVSLSNNIDININPLATGAIGTGTAKLKVATNNTTGYKIMLSTLDGSNELKSVSSSQHYEDGVAGSIKPLTTSTTKSAYLSNEDNFNTWAYALTNTPASEDTVYTGLNDSNVIVKESDSTTGNDEYDLNVAIAVDAELPAGAYRNGLVVSAVANPIALSGFAQIYYMQDMTPEICASVDEHETGQLVDKRDNNIYWVAKLRDGNCWMTQNLGLTFGDGAGMVSKLTPEDSDVTSEWVPEATRTTGGDAVTSDKQAISWRYSTNGYIGIQNYYTWDSATAESGTNLENGSQVAPSSICAKGWKLPYSVQNNARNGSFYNLMAAYGLTTKNPSIAGDYKVYQPDGNTITYTVTEGQYRVGGSPLKFNLGGNTDKGTNELGALGSFGSYWSSTPFDEKTGTRFLFSSAGSVMPFSALGRSIGASVRCVSR